MKNSILMRMTAVLLAMVLAVFAFDSCRRIKLYDATSGVYLRIHYNSPDSTRMTRAGERGFISKASVEEPESYKVCFYDFGTQRLVTEDFLTAEGGFVSVAPGTYDILVYSMGTESTSVYGEESRDAVFAYTDVQKEQTPASGMEKFKLVRDPDHIFVGKIERVEIPIQPDEGEPVSFDVDVFDFIQTYDVVLTDVQGTERIGKVDMYLSGQASSRYMWNGTYRGSAVALQSDGYAEKDMVHSVFNTFGKYPMSDNDAYLNVTVQDKKGKKHQWIFNVSEQIAFGSAVIVVGDKIVIPEGGEGEGGFTQKVDKWETEEIYAPM